MGDPEHEFREEMVREGAEPWLQPLRDGMCPHCTSPYIGEIEVRILSADEAAAIGQCTECVEDPERN